MADMTLKEKLERVIEIREELNTLEAEIKKEVLAKGSTIKEGRVEAIYSKGRRTFQYDKAVESVGIGDEEGQIPQTLIEDHTKSVVDWKAVCEAAGIIKVPFKVSNPSVSIKAAKEITEMPS